MHEIRPKNRTLDPSVRRWLAATLLLVVLASAFGHSLTRHQTRFDRAVWYANERPEATDDPRSRMADDLIANRLKIGSPRSQARALLGEPDASAQSIAGPNGPVVNDTDAYSLGFMGRAKDISTLELHYSDAGRLIRMEVVRR